MLARPTNTDNSFQPLAGVFADASSASFHSGDLVLKLTSLFTTEGALDGVLTQRESRLLFSYYQLGIPSDQIAEDFNIKAKSVTSMVFYAREKLLNHLNSIGIESDPIKKALSAMREENLQTPLQLDLNERSEINKRNLKTILAGRIRDQSLSGTVVSSKQQDVIFSYTQKGYSFKDIQSQMDLCNEGASLAYIKRAAANIQKCLKKEGFEFSVDEIFTLFQEMHRESIKREIDEWELSLRNFAKSLREQHNEPVKKRTRPHIDRSPCKSLKIADGSKIRRRLSQDLCDRLRLPVPAYNYSRFDVEWFPRAGLLIKCIPKFSNQKSLSFLVALNDGTWLEEPHEDFLREWGIPSQTQCIEDREALLLACHGFGPVPFSESNLEYPVRYQKDETEGKYSLLLNFSEDMRAREFSVPNNYPSTSILLKISHSPRGNKLLFAYTPDHLDRPFGVFRFGESHEKKPVVQFDYLCIDTHIWAKVPHEMSVSTHYENYFKGERCYPPYPVPLAVNEDCSGEKFLNFNERLPVPRNFQGKELIPSVFKSPVTKLKYVAFWKNRAEMTLSEAFPVLIVRLTNEASFEVEKDISDLVRVNPSGNKAFFKMLIKSLNDEDSYVRNQAYFILMRIKSEYPDEFAGVWEELVSKKVSPNTTNNIRHDHTEGTRVKGIENPDRMRTIFDSVVAFVKDSSERDTLCFVFDNYPEKLKAPVRDYLKLHKGVNHVHFWSAFNLMYPQIFASDPDYVRILLDSLKQPQENSAVNAWILIRYYGDECPESLADSLSQLAMKRYKKLVRDFVAKQGKGVCRSHPEFGPLLRELSL